MTTLEYIGAAVALVGPLGTLLEAAGSAFKVPALVTIGQKLENLGADLPEFFGGAKAKGGVAGSGHGSIDGSKS